MVAFLDLFINSLDAVAELFAMAAAGMLCARIGLVNQASRKFLSEMAFKVTIPCLLFSNIIKCPYHVEKEGQCQSLVVLLQSAWPFFLLPFMWVALGTLVGVVATRLARTPVSIRGTAMAACTFGNSTAVPIVLLTALSSMKFGSIDGKYSMRLRLYLSYLSIYLTTYQILLWSIGNQLLKWVPVQAPTPASSSPPVPSLAPSKSLSNPLTSITDLPLPATAEAEEPCAVSLTSEGVENGLSLSLAEVGEHPVGNKGPLIQNDQTPGADSPALEAIVEPAAPSTCWTVVLGMARNFFVPPVIGIFLGLAVGALDGLRAILVHMPNYSKPVLGWLFDAVQKFGGAAVPMVMVVLGASLASGFQRSSVHWPTAIAVTLGRLIVIPTIAFATVFFTLVGTNGPLVFGDEPHLEAAVVVGLIVSCAPTANNVVVMAELWGGPVSKQALGAMIFVQYCVAPFSLTAWICVLMAMVQKM